MTSSLRFPRLWTKYFRDFNTMGAKNVIYCVNSVSASIVLIMHDEMRRVQYIPRNMHTVTALLCFVVVIHWLIFPYPSGLLHWHCGNLTIAPVPAKQPWWIWINTSYEFIMNDCITTTKQSTTKPCAYFLGYTVVHANGLRQKSSHKRLKRWRRCLTPFVHGQSFKGARSLSVGLWRMCPNVTATYMPKGPSIAHTVAALWSQLGKFKWVIYCQ